MNLLVFIFKISVHYAMGPRNENRLNRAIDEKIFQQNIDNRHHILGFGKRPFFVGLILSWPVKPNNRLPVRLNIRNKRVNCIQNTLVVNS